MKHISRNFDVWTFSCPEMGKDSLVALYRVFFRFKGKKTSIGRFYVYQYLVEEAEEPFNNIWIVWKEQHHLLR